MAKILTKLFPGAVIKEYEIKVPAKEHNLGEIRDFITEIAGNAGFTLHEVNNLKLAIDEACSNVTRHAYKGMETGEIKMKVLWRKTGLEMKIFDQGRGFDWKHAKVPDLNRYVEIGKKGGLGIWFISAGLWTIKGSDTNVYFLSGTLTVTAPTNHVTSDFREVWQGALRLPKMKLPAMRP